MKVNRAICILAELRGDPVRDHADGWKLEIQEHAKAVGLDLDALKR